LKTQKKVKIIDSTLREGLQAPGVNLKLSQLKEIISILNTLEVNMIEIGHPAISEEHLNNIKECINLAKIPCLVHARANVYDIIQAHKSGAEWVGIFIGINHLSQKHKLNKKLFEILSLIKMSITKAKSLGLKVRFSIEDASRTALSELIEIYGIALELGADRIVYTDTVGILEPKDIHEDLRRIREVFSSIDIETHFHDDRGLAMANTLTAIDQGVNWVSSSINGLGERCGITDTLSLLANLKFRGTYNQNIEVNKLRTISDIVGAHSRVFNDVKRPVTGKNAFIHTAKLHKSAMLKNENCYCWYNGDLSLDNKLAEENLKKDIENLITTPEIISAEELKYHRKGHGDRYVMIDYRYVKDCRQYCIVRDIDLKPNDIAAPHVDSHRHMVDSLFVFIGKGEKLTGLKVKVTVDDEEKVINSPASVFIPAGFEHSYEIISGKGLFINYVLADNYNQSLLE